MKGIVDTRRSSGSRAVEALRTIIDQVSAFKLREIQLEPTGPHGEIDILACIDVFGRSHTLACKITAYEQPHQLHTALYDLRVAAARFGRNAAPVLIAPHLPHEARKLCRENEVGFLDLEGNAHLVSGEVFIAITSVPHFEPQQTAASAGCAPENYSVAAA